MQDIEVQIMNFMLEIFRFNRLDMDTDDVSYIDGIVPFSTIQGPENT